MTAPLIRRRDFPSDVGADRVEAAGTPPKAAVALNRYSLQIFSKNAP